MLQRLSAPTYNGWFTDTLLYNNYEKIDLEIVSVYDLANSHPEEFDGWGVMIWYAEKYAANTYTCMFCSDIHYQFKLL